MQSAIDDNPPVSFELAAGRGAWDGGGASQLASSCMHRQEREYNLLSEDSMYVAGASSQVFQNTHLNIRMYVFQICTYVHVTMCEIIII